MNESRWPRPLGIRSSEGVIVALWAVACLVAGAGWAKSPERFLHAYVAGFAGVVTIGLGALFFVLLHHLVHAHWSIRACVRMERLSGLLRWAPLLFVPIALNAKAIYPWLHASPSELLEHPAKAAYWTLPLFLGRSMLYLGTWWGLATWYRRATHGQSPTSDEGLRRLSGPAMIVFGLTTIFASFDWWMGLERHFHSGIFGVYVFAGAAVVGLAVLAIVTTCSDNGQQPAHFIIEERHDIGKLLFGFVAFWAYIAFCQYLIIWYAGIPHEVAFYHKRLSWPWRSVTALLVMLHFVVPFIVLLSRSTKRSRFDLLAVSVIVLVAHQVDAFWLVMPALQPAGSKLGLPELGAACMASMVTLHFTLSAVRTPLGEFEAKAALPQPCLPMPGTEQRTIPHGAHVALLPPVPKAAAPHRIGPNWRLIAVSSGVAFLALVGGTASASKLDSRLRQEVARKRSESIQRATATQVVAGRDEYQWLDQKNGKLRIPVQVARALVLSEYASRSSTVAKAGKETAAQ